MLSCSLLLVPIKNYELFLAGQVDSLNIVDSTDEVYRARTWALVVLVDQTLRIARWCRGRHWPTEYTLNE